VEEKAVFEMIAAGKCPTCHGTGLETSGEQVHCRVCGMRGNPKLMKWCLTVPVFEPVDTSSSSFSGQLYQDSKGGYWKMAGQASGCGREVTGMFCDSCRYFLPHAVDHAVRKSRARPARAGGSVEG
jgi:hypothetical protein